MCPVRGILGFFWSERITYIHFIDRVSSRTGLPILKYSLRIRNWRAEHIIRCVVICEARTSYSASSQSRSYVHVICSKVCHSSRVYIGGFVLIYRFFITHFVTNIRSLNRNIRILIPIRQFHRLHCRHMYYHFHNSLLHPRLLSHVRWNLYLCIC